MQDNEIILESDEAQLRHLTPPPQQIRKAEAHITLRSAPPSPKRRYSVINSRFMEIQQIEAQTGRLQVEVFHIGFIDSHPITTTRIPYKLVAVFLSLMALFLGLLTSDINLYINQLALPSIAHKLLAYLPHITLGLSALFGSLALHFTERQRHFVSKIGRAPIITITSKNLKDGSLAAFSELLKTQTKRYPLGETKLNFAQETKLLRTLQEKNMLSEQAYSEARDRIFKHY